MAAPKDVLLLTWDGGGNVPPILGIAHELSRRGHRVRVLGPTTLAKSIMATGAEFRPFTSAPEFDPSLAVEDQAQAYIPYWAGEVLAGELRAELARQPADALVIDCMLLGALAAAERSGVPTAVLVHFLYAPAVGQWGRGWEWARESVNTVRGTLGLELLQPDGRTLVDQIWKRLALVLVTTASAFDEPLEEIASNVRYVGPVRFDGGDTWTWDLPWPAGDPRPLVCVSLSSTYQHQEDLLQRVADATADLDAHVLVLSGGVDATTLRLPPNAAARSWVPHPAVLPHTAAMVTHAGHGTSILSLAYGVPLVCIPMGRDQHLVGGRVVAAGAGVVVAQDAIVSEIREAILAVLMKRTFCEQARHMAELIGPHHDGRDAATAVEAMTTSA